MYIGTCRLLLGATLIRGSFHCRAIPTTISDCLGRIQMAIVRWSLIRIGDGRVYVYRDSRWQS